MLSFFKKILGLGPKTNYAELVAQGAIIIDVRTTSEFSSGHVKGSKNMPLNSFSNQLNKLKDKNKTYILCCASGMRSGQACSILKSNGYQNVYNAGSWRSLNQKI